MLATIGLALNLAATLALAILLIDLIAEKLRR